MTSKLKKYHLIFIGLFSILLFFGLTGCNDEIFSTNPKYKLTLSADTLTFDTVFATIGSTTSKIMIYNHNNVALKISHLGIAGGKESSFKINVDGSLNANNQFENLEIRAKDSMYIFVSVTVDPNNSNSPVFIQDSLVLQTNGVNQSVKFQAYGQNVKIFRSKNILNDTTLTAEKAYLIYGNLTVDTAKTLIIKAGCKFYFHNNANMIIYGNIKAEGTYNEPISMRGDRLDKLQFSTPFPYNNVAGQWGGLYLLWKGGNHILRHVNMNSGYVGIYFSNEDRNISPNLEIVDCRIHNFLIYGLYTQNGNVQVANTEISNTSSNSVYLSGGKHRFIQCTIANYFDNSSIQPTSRDGKPAVMIMNLNRTAPMESVFRNCLITGSESNEFSLVTRYPDQYNGIFDHCYIRKSNSLSLPQFTNIRWYKNNDIVLKSIHYNYEKNTYFNFMPDSLSPARGLADPAVAAQFPVDLNGNSRINDGAPDAGAYEWQSTK